MTSRKLALLLIIFSIGVGGPILFSQQPKPEAPPKKEAKAKAKKTKGTAGVAMPLASAIVELKKSGHQYDLPSAAAGPDGDVFVAYIDHDGISDRLRISKNGSPMANMPELGKPGIIHHPAITVDDQGDAWCFWGRTGDDDTVDLLGCKVTTDGPEEPFVVSDTEGSESFADSGADSDGRVWVAWQSSRDHRPDIYTKFLTPDRGEWSGEIRVSKSESGDWEPALAFDKEGNAWIGYDSADGNEFNINLACVSAEGDVKTFPIAHSPQYEARASIAPAADGSGFWIAAERGKVRWGLDSRGHGNNTGINAKKSVLFGKFDTASGEFETIPLGHAGQLGAPVNLPEVGVSPDGRPWVAYRYFEKTLWRVGLTRHDPATSEWSSRRFLESSSFGQDRSSNFLTGDDGKLWLCWTSDLRDNKTPKEAGIYLAAIDPAIELPAATPGGKEVVETLDEPFPPSHATPERPFDSRHTWKVEGQEYGLYWGDVHRHTDVSNCRTGFDGCITEHFRYAYDIGKLDFLGTSDHTDIGKTYSPYEWWHNQKMHDAFHTPTKFNSLYVYEREQKWPWGHRNVVFAERGGPVVYINRKTYRDSIWQKDLPVKAGVNEILPSDLWDVLKRSGKNVALVSHTGATRMGTDWHQYEEGEIDYDIETLVEIFQGARVSYEAQGAPQPTVGLKDGEEYTVSANAEGADMPPAPVDDFKEYNNGTYQTALELGHKLGVFTSSDHISTHVSYGGVFCKEFTRDGIIEGFKARRTIAATDKIYLDFACNGKPLGSIFDSSENPELWFQVDGTADLKRVTIVRNEKSWKTFESFDGNLAEKTVVDDAPLPGVNRYYVRVEQTDGNMAWSSPVWVTMK